MLCAVGDLIEDVVVQLHGDMRRDSDTAATIVRRRGGSAANVAYFAAKLTGASRFVGNVGSDPLGDSLIAQLTRFDVDVCGERSGHTGSIVVIATPDGERTMLTDRGDATGLSRWDPRWLESVTVLHLPLYSFTDEPIASCVDEAVRQARVQGITVSIDLSSVSVIEALSPPAVRALIEDVQPDLMFCTSAEAEAISVASGDLYGARMAVIKDGARPVRTIDDNGEVETFEVNAAEFVVDGTGAGDAFAAGFLCGHAASAQLAQRVAAAQAVAARVVARAGATLEDA